MKKASRRYVPPTPEESQAFVDAVLTAMSKAKTIRKLLNDIVPLRAQIIRARYAHGQRLTLEDRFYFKRCRRILATVV